MLKRKIFRDELRALCIRKDWYTRGNIKQYDNLFEMITDKNITDNLLLKVANDIFEHSDIERFMNEYSCSDTDVYANIVYELGEITHVFYERESITV